jgi:FkbM family methyltransferase
MNIPPIVIKILNRLGWLPTFNLRSSTVVKGHKLGIPILGGQGVYNLSLSEPWMTETLTNLKPLFNGNFIDIGVNLGQTLLKAHAVFGSIKYAGFEPNPSCVHYVQELIRVNKLDGYNIFPLGVASQTDVLKLNFFDSDKSDSAATIIENYRPGNKEHHFIYVPVFDYNSIKKFLPENNFSILKIDVEGSELDVLQGLYDWIQAFTPLILVEILPVYSADNQYRLQRQSKIELLFKDLDYKIARIRKKDTVQLAQIESIGIHSNIEDSDYLAYPSTLSDKIIGLFNKEMRQ